MAQHVSVQLVDDLDGSAADLTVSFALDGQQYEIDLSTGNGERLRAALEPYVAGARRAGRPVAGTIRKRTRTEPEAQQAAGTVAIEENAAMEPAATEEPAVEETATEQAAPEPTSTGVPSAHFSNPTSHPATRLGATTKPGSVEIFTHRA
jgi:hypothetical protein